METNAQTGGTPKASSITEEDRADLIALLKMRFGEVPAEVMAAIAAINDFSRIDHLILVAANAAGWEQVLAELRQPGFRIVGQDFDPLKTVQKPEQKSAQDGRGQ